MTELPAAPRRYDEQEVALLLKRAAELQRSTPTARDPGGLTLSELEEIAAEAGLDITTLRQAAAELDAGISPAGSTLASRFTGAPLRLVLERSVGREFPPASFSELLPLVLTAADLTGHASQVGQTFTWTSQDPGNIRQMQVLVSSANGQTRIRVEERYSGLAGAVFGGGLGGIGGGVGGGIGGALGGAFGSVILGLGVPAVVIGATYFGCRAVYRRFVTRRRHILERLVQQLDEYVTGHLAAEQVESGEAG